MKKGQKNWWIVLAGICINLVWYTKKVIITTSSNEVQKMIYRNIYYRHDISGLEINPYKRYSSVLDQSSSSLARGDDNYWKANCYVFVWLPCCFGTCYFQLCLEIIVHQAILGDLYNQLLSFENRQLQ